MANFFYATAIYSDGSTKYFKGRLWFLGGAKDKEGHALLQSLKDKKANGEIITLHVSYES